MEENTKNFFVVTHKQRNVIGRNLTKVDKKKMAWWREAPSLATVDFAMSRQIKIIQLKHFYEN